MGNRSHLIPTVTVDKNGHQKTVYVTTENSTSSSRSFGAPVIAKHYEDEAIEDSFGPEWDGVDDPQSWINNGIENGEEAYNWADAGFDADAAGEWYGETCGGGLLENAELSDLYTMYTHDIYAEDAPMWLQLVKTVHGLEGGEHETLNDVINTMNGGYPSAGDEYSKYFPYRQWSILSEADVDYGTAHYVKDFQGAIDKRHQEVEGESYLKDDDKCLREAVRWVPAESSHELHRKEWAIRQLISMDASPDDYEEFLLDTDSHCSPDQESLKAVMMAQEWTRSIRQGHSSGESQERYATFRGALIQMDGLEEIVEQHGADRVGSALSQGMSTEPQLRNFLENIPVAGISEGAL